MIPINVHCRVFPLLVKRGEQVFASQEIARAMGLPTGLLHIAVLFHSEAEMRVWQDQAHETLGPDYVLSA